MIHTTCPKCGGGCMEEVGYVPYYDPEAVNWNAGACSPDIGCDAFAYNKHVDDPLKITEHLHVTCGVCGYRVAVPCRDSS